MKVNSITNARSEYRKVFGVDAPRASTITFLEESVSAKRAALRNEIEANLAAKKLANKVRLAERESIVKGRGTFEEFTALERSDVSKENETLHYVMCRVAMDVDKYEKALAEFKEGLEKYALRTLEWSDGMFDHAARKSVADAVIRMFNDGATYVEMKKNITDYAIGRGYEPSRSTSNGTNLIRQCEAAAWCRMAMEFRA